MRIDISNLAFSYPGKKILHDINVTMNDSEIVCLVGPNGSGKSTILLILAIYFLERSPL